MNTDQAVVPGASMAGLLAAQEEIMAPTAAHGVTPATRASANVRPHLRTCLIWLAAVSACTVIGLAERWPAAQFGGAGDPSKIATQWMTKGTALSPPLFMLAAMAAAVVLMLAGSRARARALGACLALMVGVVSVIGTLGEVVAPATPAVPRAVQYGGVFGAAGSLAVVVTGAAFLRARLRAQPVADGPRIRRSGPPGTGNPGPRA
jgi:hypothetical protein